MAIVDISTAQNRTKYFGYLNAAFAVGFILGPLFGGILGTHNLRLSFVFTEFLTLANLVHGYYFFPETNQKKTKTGLEPSLNQIIVNWKTMKNTKSICLLLLPFFCYLFLLTVWKALGLFLLWDNTIGINSK